MGTAIDTFTTIYRQNGTHMKKKAEYTFVFFVIMSIYSIVNIFFEATNTSNNEWLPYVLLFYVMCQVVMFVLLRSGHLQIAQYVFFILGVTAGIRYMVLNTHYQFYTHLVVLLIVGLTIHVSKVQMMIIYSYVNIVAIIRAYFLYSLISAGYIDDFMLNQSFQATLGIFLLSMVIAYFSKVINSGIKETKELGEISVTDSLTHLSNRSRYNIRMKEMSDNNKPYVLALLDIDHFKKINDKLGHDKGDYVLITLANLMRDFFDDSFELYRWGGEEFALVVEDGELDYVHSKLNDFRDHVANWDFGLGYPLTLSGGIYVNRDKLSAEQAAIYADNALYDAKEQGRDRIVISEVVTVNE